MWSLSKPADAAVRAFLAEQSTLGFTYRHVGASLDGAPAGFTLDHYRTEVGHGQAAFEAACRAIRAWRMFPAPWTEIHPAEAPIETGRVVAVLVRAFGLWWMNAARIVYVLDEQANDANAPLRRFGFAYGTLPGHVECGEERFSVEWDSDDRVWYDIRAFSRPRFWLARLGYPFARRLQRRFARDSHTAVRRAVGQASSPTSASQANGTMS